MPVVTARQKAAQLLLAAELPVDSNPEREVQAVLGFGWAMLAVADALAQIAAPAAGDGLVEALEKEAGRRKDYFGGPGETAATPSEETPA